MILIIFQQLSILQLVSVVNLEKVFMFDSLFNSNDVSSLQQLVNSIESDHSTTETTLSDTEECLDIVANDVGIITSNLAEVG